MPRYFDTDKIESGELNGPVRMLSEAEVIKLLNQFTLERMTGLTDKNFNSWLLSLVGNYNSVAFREDIIRKVNGLLG